MSDWKNVQYKNGKYRTSDEGGGGASALTDLTDVNVSSPSDGQVLKYDSTTQKWKNENESGGGSVEDVTLDGTSVVNGQGVAELTTPNVNDLKDTNISSPSSGQILQYNAATQKWENATPASGGNVDDVKVNGTSVVTNKVANIKSYKEVTQAQYEALPDTKLSDDVLYAIKDSNGAAGFPPLIYSDIEREVGVWIDGKPLYQKTIDCGTMPNQASKAVAHGISNIDKVVECFGITYRDSDGVSLPLSIALEPASMCGLIADKTNITLQANTSWGNYGYTYTKVTLKYTKTTDTAGSGSWATTGGFAHHYSETEQVVGTWIDGKTIYEKTLSCNTASNQTVDIDISALNVDTPLYVYMTGRCQLNGTDWTPGPSGYYQDNTDGINAYILSDKSKIRVRSRSSYPRGPIYVTFQYTKTSS